MNVPSKLLQEAVSRFTMSRHHWTAYDASKISAIAVYEHLIPPGSLYVTFDPDKEEAVFQAPVDMPGRVIFLDDPISQRLTLYEHLRQWWRELPSRHKRQMKKWMKRLPPK